VGWGYYFCNLKVQNMIQALRRDESQGFAAPQLGDNTSLVVLEVTAEMLEYESRVRDLQKLGMEEVPLLVL
jgi:peptide deformylase